MIWGGADTKIIETKCTVDAESSPNHSLHPSPWKDCLPRTSLCCQKSRGPLGRRCLFSHILAQMVRSLPASARDIGDSSSIPGSGRSPREGNGYPLQYSCLENSMDRGAWWATLHGVSKRWTQLRLWLKLNTFNLEAKG